MRCVIDIDGPVARFSELYNAWVERTYGYWPVPCDRWDWYLDYPDGQALWDAFYTPEVLPAELQKADVTPGAVEGLKLLARWHQPFFVTHRPHWTKEATRAWLDDHDMRYPLVHVEQHKADIDAGLYIDDHAATITQIRALGRNGFLWDAPWNRHVNGLPRVHAWRDVLVEADKAATMQRSSSVR